MVSVYETADAPAFDLGALFGFLGIFAIVFAVLGILTLIAEWKMYNKLGKPGWAVLIPVYNNYVLFDAVWSKKAFWEFSGFIAGVMLCSMLCKYLTGIVGLLVVIVALVLMICSLVWCVRCYHRISRAFGHGVAFTAGLIVLPIIFLMILGFSSKEEVGC